MKKQLRVVLLIESSRAFGRGLLAGIAAYSMTHGPWTFYHEERSIDDPIPHGLRRWAPDGCIGRIWPTLESQVRRLGVATVNVLGESAIPKIPNSRRTIGSSSQGRGRTLGESRTAAIRLLRVSRFGVLRSSETGLLRGSSGTRSIR